MCKSSIEYVSPDYDTDGGVRTPVVIMGDNSLRLKVPSVYEFDEIVWFSGRCRLDALWVEVRSLLCRCFFVKVCLVFVTLFFGLDKRVTVTKFVRDEITYMR